MSELMSLQDLANGHLDIKALGEAANGDENTTVVTRTGETYPSAKKAIKTLLEQGTIDAELKPTKALLDADTVLVDGDFALIYNDDDVELNGYYQKQAGVWEYLPYNIQRQALNKIEQAKQAAIDAAAEDATTKADTAKLQSIEYIDAKSVVNAQILGSTNLDTLLTQGEFVQPTINIDFVALNYPTNAAGFLTVIKSADSAFALQVYYVASTRTTYSRWHDGTVWSTWGASSEYKSYVDGNPNFKSKSIPSTDDLDSYVISGDYTKIASGDIGADKHYPVQLAGHLRVDAASSNAVVQTYTVYSTGNIYVRTKTSIWSTWTKIINESALTAAISAQTGSLKKLEWQTIPGGSVNYDATTRTVSIIGYVLAAFENAAGRIRINDISVPMPGAYDVCFLDLNKLGSVNSIDATNYTQYLFVGSYSGAGDLQYRAKLGQVALFKYDSVLSKVIPCAGFVPIKYATDSDGGGEQNQSGHLLQFTKTADLLSVYIPQVSGKQLFIGLKHDVVPAEPATFYQANADLWRLKQVYRCDELFTKELELVNIGELELAITHTENTQASGVNKDHVGGYHGDELLTQANFYVDGVRKNADFTQAGLGSAKELQLVQHSVIYYQGTLRPLADHVKVVTFKGGVFNVTQKLDFKYESTQLSTAWITMLPILRTGAGGVQITDSSSRSDDYYLQVDDNTTTAFTNRFTPIKDGSVFKQWLSTGKISSETTLIKTPNFSVTQNAFITNGAGYNKLYVSATDATLPTPYDIPLNTVWEWETEYKIKC